MCAESMKMIVVRPLLINVYMHSKAVTLLDILSQDLLSGLPTRSGYHAGASPNSFDLGTASALPIHAPQNSLEQKLSFSQSLSL
jgi:hypothetical protein